MFTIGKYESFVSNGLRPLDTKLSYLPIVNTVWDPKNVHSFLTLIGS